MDTVLMGTAPALEGLREDKCLLFSKVRGVEVMKSDGSEQPRQMDPCRA
jgi:hypothetical protein